MSELSVRPPAVAGQFYQGDPDGLRRQVQAYVEQAVLPDDLGPVRAVVAPHADLAVARQPLAKLIELEAQSFLEADNVRVVVADHVPDERPSHGPGVLPIVRCAVADVEGHDDHVAPGVPGAPGRGGRALLRWRLAERQRREGGEQNHD